MLTDHCEVDQGVPRRRRLEVHPAPVDPLLRALDLLEAESGGGGAAGLEEGPRAEAVHLVRPPAAVRAAAAPGVVTGSKGAEKLLLTRCDVMSQREKSGAHSWLSQAGVFMSITTTNFSFYRPATPKGGSLVLPPLNSPSLYSGVIMESYTSYSALPAQQHLLSRSLPPSYNA